ncbi:MAG: MFS transporter [Chloroflexi bacterium]|nr:MFS transporter [Chloroflexota bacterium]
MLLLIGNTNFRLLWSGGLLIAIGTWTFVMVHGWLTLNVTDSSLWVGAATGAGGVGMVSLVGLGGVLADRLPRRRLVVASGLIRAAAAIFLAITIHADAVHLWQILGTSFLFGAAEAIRAPSYMALIVDIVGRERAIGANAANFAAMGVAGVLAPLIGAGIVSAWGLEWAYVFVVGAELVAAILLTGIKLPSAATLRRGLASGEPSAVRHESPWRSFKQGASYVFSTPRIRTLILMGLVGETFGWAHMSMLPVMARDVLGAGVSGLGYLQSASFAGFLISTLAMSSVRDIPYKGRFMVGGAAGFGLLLVAFAASRSLPLSVALLVAAYASGALYEVGLTTLIQTIVPDRMRGRVVSFQAFTWGINGVSGFYMGGLATLLGAPSAIVIGAGVMLVSLVRLAPGVSRIEEEGAGDEADRLVLD